MLLRNRHPTLGPILSGNGLRPRAVAAIARIFDFAFGCVYLVLGLRFVLELLRARRASGFFTLVTAVSGPFYSPFKDIVGTSTFAGAYPLVWSLVFAMVAYALLHGVIRALLRVVSGRD
jgi:YGGT family